MDADRFDTLTRTLSGTGTRRGALAALLAGTLGLLGLSEAAAKNRRRASAEGPCGNGSPKANTCKKDKDCCTHFCDEKKGRCRCKKLGESCTEDRNCCATFGQPMTCQNSICAMVEPVPPPPVCPGLGQICTIARGAACCPTVDPNVVCTSAAVPSLARHVCQDCTQAPTVAGVLCQTPVPGNQCCGGSPNCFVALRVQDSQPVCLAGQVCNPFGSPCSLDAQCPMPGQGANRTVCVRNDANCCGVGGGTTLCGTPCTTP